MTQYFVYKITNQVNGKFYIGKTANIKKRWQKHLSSSKTQNPKDYSYIHRAINKYGAENFTIEEIERYTTEEEALDAEIKFIEIYNSTNRSIGYNISIGGDKGMTGFKHSEKTKKQIGKANSGKSPSLETREKMSRAHTGTKRTNETKQKMCNARAKQILSPEHIYNFSHSNKGRHLSNERKIQISLASRGENNKSSKLKEEQVLLILKLRSEGWKRKQLIDHFNIPAGTLDSIIYGNSWTYLASKETEGAFLASASAEK